MVPRCLGPGWEGSTGSSYGSVDISLGRVWDFGKRSFSGRVNAVTRLGGRGRFTVDEVVVRLWLDEIRPNSPPSLALSRQSLLSSVES